MIGRGVEMPVLWPDAEEVMAAVRGVLHAEGGPEPDHPALRVVCDLARAYFVHAEAVETCAAPPLLVSYERMCDDWSAMAAAEQRLIDRFNAIAAQRFCLGEGASPGHLAARLVYWILRASPHSVHHSHAAINAYDRWRASLLADPSTTHPIAAACT